MNNTYFLYVYITKSYGGISIETNSLQAFLTVVQEKTISKAAEALHISQPALSRKLKNLEAEVGTTLFHRGSHEITLTDSGRYLFDRGKQILSLIDSTEKNLAQNNTISGQITIGGAETQSFDLIAQVIKETLSTYPTIKINLYSGNADDVLEKIDNGLLDFGLVIDPVEKQKYEYIKLPTYNSWGILVSDAHVLAKKKHVMAKDLEGYPLMISSQSFVDNQLAEWLGKNIEHYNIVGTYNLLYNASLIAKNGIAVVLCLDGIINTADTNLVFIPFSPSLEVPISMVWKKNTSLSTASSTFLNFIFARYTE